MGATTPSLFGSPATAPAPAFGAAPAPAFGATTTPAFGTSNFFGGWCLCYLCVSLPSVLPLPLHLELQPHQTLVPPVSLVGSVCVMFIGRPVLGASFVSDYAIAVHSLEAELGTSPGQAWHARYFEVTRQDGKLQQEAGDRIVCKLC